MNDQDIAAWTLTPESVVPCFVEDVLETLQPVQNRDYWLLKRAPCRSVRVVGMLMSAKQYESRNVYDLDDGTGVVECIERFDTLAPSPSKRRPLVSPQPRYNMKRPHPLGSIVSVTGTVKATRRSRQLNFCSLAPCVSANAEAEHWLEVMDAHGKGYSLPQNTLDPSQEPSLTVSQSPYTFPVNSPIEIPSSPQLSPTPAPPSATSTSIKGVLTLRHPSRLHSRDLVDLTLPTYLKFFMNGVSAFSRNANPSLSLSELRRVPELSLLSQSIVRVARRKRERSARKDGKPPPPDDSTGRKVKRLFQWAIRSMIHDGSIVIWDGSRVDASILQQVAAEIWSTKASGADLTRPSSDFTTLSALPGSEALVLSDPPKNEETYTLVSAKLLAPSVEDVLSAWLDRPPHNGLSPTAEELHERLQRDRRWEYTGLWSVKDSLDLLHRQERAWRDRTDRWQLVL